MTGRWQITECPLKIITPDLTKVIELANFYEKGLPPVAGGVLDQAHIFNEACRLIFGIENVLKKKMEVTG